MESGHVVKPSNGWYQRAGEDKKYRFDDTETRDFWLPILTDKSFHEFVERKYSVAYGDILKEEDTVEEVYGTDDEEA